LEYQNFSDFPLIWQVVFKFRYWKRGGSFSLPPSRALGQDWRNHGTAGARRFSPFFRSCAFTSWMLPFLALSNPSCLRDALSRDAFVKLRLYSRRVVDSSGLAYAWSVRIASHHKLH